MNKESRKARHELFTTIRKLKIHNRAIDFEYMKDQIDTALHDMLYSEAFSYGNENKNTFNGLEAQLKEKKMIQELKKSTLKK